MLVSEMLQDAVKYDETLMAHTLYYAIKKQIITMQDTYDLNHFDQLTKNDHLIIRDMIQEDYLKMRIVKLFAVPLTKKEFAFYLSKTADDIAALHFHHFKKPLSKIINAHKMLDTGIFMPDSMTYTSFRQIAKQTVDYPTLVCVLEGS